MGGRETAGPLCRTNTRTSPGEAAQNKQRPGGSCHAAQCLTWHGLLATGLQHAQTLRPLFIPIPGKPQPGDPRSPQWETAVAGTAGNATSHRLLQKGTEEGFLKDQLR